MSATDPVGELVLLVRGAAEAGLDWHSRLRREWLPHVLATVPPAALVAAIAEWREGAEAGDSGLAAQLEAVVLAAMAEQGY